MNRGGDLARGKGAQTTLSSRQVEPARPDDCQRCHTPFGLQLGQARRDDWYPDLCTSCSDEPPAFTGETLYDDENEDAVFDSRREWFHSEYQIRGGLLP